MGEVWLCDRAPHKLQFDGVIVLFQMCYVPLKIFQVHPMLCMSWYMLMIYGV